MLSVVLGMLGKDQQVVRCRGFGGGIQGESSTRHKGLGATYNI